ncbi:sodium/calcium exchanger membrane region [Halogeometricum pallidum JCM 14848]|uniref:Sodium/calcium exchanger membrane region n=1 Tax=Halogeometricum pallidum JCM 14848 TaxID=1227487 RepID=M0D8L9_HALPD|nr:sodium/calcium exchanger membrane region [Halogeometricum pallidum]ELZ31183.1 sodium/calcium exchanger membrane region [Halogeometricum pallidum JCM 14848]
MLDRLRHPLVAVVIALLLTVPWIGLFFSYGGYGTVHPGENITPGTAVLVAGLAILGASFLLAWAAETAEKDVPQAFAIAVLAVLAVAPEYAVDALYAWQAGAGSDQAANLAVANMTGANRILIGLGWSGIALFTIFRAKSGSDPAVEHRSGFMADVVGLDRDIATEITFLLAATAFAFFVPFSGGIGPVDTLFLVGLYVLYLFVIIRGGVEEHEENVGVPAYFQEKSKGVRIASVLAGFAFSGAIIFTAVHPFAEGLETLGLQYGIPEFFMIQWLAPLASESPELIVVAYLVNKARSTAGFNALISSKLNQWTLLIGTLAVVYSISAGAIGTLPFDSKQAAEIWITAAQSLFAIAILTNFEISTREAVTLLVLFVTQVLAEFYVIQTYGEPAATNLSMTILYAYTAVYLVLGFALFFKRRESLTELVGRTLSNARDAVGGGGGKTEHAD